MSEARPDLRPQTRPEPRPDLRPTDVHQHLWPPRLVDALQARQRPPMLRGWTLHTAAEAPYAVRAADHDAAARVGAESAGTRVLVSLSTPLGIEGLPTHEAAPLLDAWHAGVPDLPATYRGWAAAGEREPDLEGLARLLAADFVGLQVSATTWATPAALEANAAVLRLCEQLDRPVLVHPGPCTSAGAAATSWWPALVEYPAQLQAAWWSWHTVGRTLLPDLRVCFAAGAGLAPLHHERFAVRSGQRFVVDRDVFVDISSYGRQAVDALSRALGIDVLVMGSDRPYAEPPEHHLGAAAEYALRVANPARLLLGEN